MRAKRCHRTLHLPSVSKARPGKPTLKYGETGGIRGYLHCAPTNRVRELPHAINVTRVGFMSNHRVSAIVAEMSRLGALTLSIYT